MLISAMLSQTPPKYTQVEEFLNKALKASVGHLATETA
jgi:hypothetical protein